MDKCREVIRRVAPRDHRMYDHYAARFEQRIAALGPSFAARVTQYKAAVSEIQGAWKKVPRKQFICRYHPETSSGVASLQQHLLRCPVAGGASLCQATYAHRLFECPWQYVPNSTLSDPLGCWRPSSGFN